MTRGLPPRAAIFSTSTAGAGSYAATEAANAIAVD
jgi:hypothetical protein